VRVIPVALVSESTASACGCTAPTLHWSEVYGPHALARRLYFFCAKCRTFGFVAFPAVNWGEPSILDGVSKADLLAAAESEFDGLPTLPEMAGIFRRAADDVFTRRERCAEVHVETFGKAISEAAVAGIVARAHERAREHADRVAYETRRIAEVRAKLEAELARATKQRKRVFGRTLKRRKPVARSEFPVIARGEHHHGAVIYGLIDPREPNRVRYVGQARRAGARLAAHLSDSTHPHTKKDRWIAGLAAEGLYPDMVLLERTKPDADVDLVERWWIAQMVAKGEADMNTASVPATQAATERAR